MTQLHLAPPAPDDDADLDRRFAQFHAENPHVYRTLVQLAREAVRKGRRRIGMKMLWERLRWELFIDTTEREPKLNNSFTSRYARLVMEHEPDLAGVFETRELKSRAA